MSEITNQQPGPWGAGKNWKAPFFTIWSGQAFSLLGSQLVQFSLVWWLTQTTGSATVLATATLVALLPQIFLAPLTGPLVDRWNRRRVMIFADASIALSTLALAFLFASGNVQIWQVYLLMFLRGVGGGFHWPAMQASTSLMVPKENLSRIQGLNQMLHGMMNIGSAPLAALLLAVLPMQGILMIDVGTAALAILPLLFIPIPQPERSTAPAAAQGGTSFGQELKAGFRYVFGWSGLLAIMIAATLINFLLTPASALQPILVTDHFGGGAMQLAWLEAAWGVGVVAGGLTLGAWGGFRRRVLTSLVFLVLLGVGNVGIGLLPPSGLYAAVALVFVIGFTNPLINGPLLAVVQDVVAPDMQGRVFTLIISASTLMTPLSLIVAGPLADAFGVQTWFIVGGICTSLLGIALFFVPSLMNIEQGSTHKPQGTDLPASPAMAVNAVEVTGD